jgi:hypothetical protein
MFTGIIKSIGRVSAIEKDGSKVHFTVESANWDSLHQNLVFEEAFEGNEPNKIIRKWLPMAHFQAFGAIRWAKKVFVSS